MASIFSKSKMAKLVYAKDQNTLITLAQSMIEAKNILVMWQFVQVGLSKDEFEELPAPKQKLIELIDRRWHLTNHWLMHPPRLRYTAYPFNLPKVREYVKHWKTWFDWQEATLSLCAAVRVSSPSVRSNPRYFSEFALYGGCAWEYRMAQIEGIKAGIESTITNECEINLNALNKYDDWLKKRVTGDPREQSIWWGETLREILFEAGDLNSSDAPIKDWVKKARAHYRFMQRAKGLRRICADDDKNYYIDRTRKQPIII